MLLKTGNFLVGPERPAPGRFTAWSDEKIRATALDHYQGAYSVHRHGPHLRCDLTPSAANPRPHGAAARKGSRAAAFDPHGGGPGRLP
ncbi:hypothetical protein [Streptomyces sp. NPDC056921]|uniref:hypothetical protein n=1 Tax=Streptomyces sp. NPDC056921 TaxID=3345966 RepID=UPI003631CADD